MKSLIGLRFFFGTDECHRLEGYVYVYDTVHTAWHSIRGADMIKFLDPPMYDAQDDALKQRIEKPKWNLVQGHTCTPRQRETDDCGVCISYLAEQLMRANPIVSLGTNGLRLKKALAYLISGFIHMQLMI
ncbi:Aste57867_24565 [Aphanomyces stellatus]|uniref:Aste57867_24565 protein n=1 Tax=Aphanomyces stellatus TaxID=120398 RepID=A0A485LSC1_9STRA|nr:hypothetical protein As57867_024487 [Aphanomyces stellatus]VFU01204.1 Aste57867_24565 [Aphanomyces stellatus]